MGLKTRKKPSSSKPSAPSKPSRAGTFVWDKALSKLVQVSSDIPGVSGRRKSASAKPEGGCGRGPCGRGGCE